MRMRNIRLQNCYLNTDERGHGESEMIGDDIDNARRNCMFCKAEMSFFCCCFFILVCYPLKNIFCMATLMANNVACEEVQL